MSVRRGPPSDLFRRRLLFVVGKGGVGKSTVALALALEGQRRGKRVLLVEIEGAARLRQFLGLPAGSEAFRVIDPTLSLLSVDGKAALDEYLGLVIPVRRVLRAVFASRLYQYFVAAAPGLKELMTVGKIWYEAERRAEGVPLWDLIVVDAPATGHILQYLRMPRAAYETFRTGLVHTEAKKVMDLLGDPRRAAVNLVTTAEEMPVNETCEIYRQLSDDLRLPLGLLVVNRLHRPRFDSAAVDVLRRLMADLPVSRRVVVREVVARADEELGWAGVNDRYLRRLDGEVPLPRVELPFLFSEEFGLPDVQQLAGMLAEQLEGAVRRRAVGPE